jgi:hypothetical protein
LLKKKKQTQDNMNKKLWSQPLHICHAFELTLSLSHKISRIKYIPSKAPLFFFLFEKKGFLSFLLSHLILETAVGSKYIKTNFMYIKPWRERGRGGAAAVQHGLPSYRDDWVVQQTRLGGTGLSLTSPTHCSSVEKQNKLHNKK